jgi:hypothetical protein
LFISFQDVFSFANESLPHHYHHSEEDFEYDLPEPMPYRPKLKNYVHYDTESQENDDLDEYASHRFVIKNYRNKIKNYQFATKSKHNQLVEDEELEVSSARHRPSAYRKPSMYTDTDDQEYEYRDSVPHESIEHKSVHQNTVHQSPFKNSAVQHKPAQKTPMSFASVQHTPSQHTPIKVASNHQTQLYPVKQMQQTVSQQTPIQQTPINVNYNKQNDPQHQTQHAHQTPIKHTHQTPSYYDSAPETPIFHQPTQTYIHSPSTFQLNLAPVPTYSYAQEEHVHSLPQTYVQPNEPQYQENFDYHGHDTLPLHHVQHPMPQAHYEQHYSPQPHVGSDPHLQTHAMISPVFHPQQQQQQQQQPMVNQLPFLNQHTLLPVANPQQLLNAHTLLTPQTLVYPQTVAQPTAPHLIMVPQKFKKTKKRKVIKLRVRVNKRRKSQRNHAPYHHQKIVQKLYPVNVEPHTEHHEPQESQHHVRFVHPRATTRQYSQGLITKLQKHKPYTKSEKKYRVKRDTSLDLFTHQSIISKEDRWVAGVSTR